MKLYRTNYEVNGVTRHTWQGTQADAKAERLRLGVAGHREVSTDDEEVPTDKPGLLAWLNANVTGE